MRFYVSPDSIFPEGKIIEIKDRQELHHIRDVMRLEKGTSVCIFDGIGKEYVGDIKEINRNSVIIEIKNCKDYKNKRPFKATLYQAIAKKGKMDSIVEKAVELGVDRIVPIVTERTVVTIDKKANIKRGRWSRIARSASKQCGRIRLPAISEISYFNRALIESEKSDMVIFAAMDRDARPLKEILKGSNPKSVAIFVGPEGDFSQGEIAMARKQGYRICSLGQSVLKVETAAIYILSCLNYEYS